MSTKYFFIFVMLIACTQTVQVKSPKPLPQKEEAPISSKDVQTDLPAEVALQTMRGYGFNTDTTFIEKAVLDPNVSYGSCGAFMDLRMTGLGSLALMLDGEECAITTTVESTSGGTPVRALLAECRDSIQTLVVTFPEEHPEGGTSVVVGYLDSIRHKKCLWEGHMLSYLGEIDENHSP